jgi:hypothetical protein
MAIRTERGLERAGVILRTTAAGGDSTYGSFQSSALRDGGARERAGDARFDLKLPAVRHFRINVHHHWQRCLCPASYARRFSPVPLSRWHGALNALLLASSDPQHGLCLDELPSVTMAICFVVAESLTTEGTSACSTSTLVMG